MNIFQEPLFLALLDNAVPTVVLKADPPNFTIVTFNDAFKRMTHVAQRDVIGWYLWEAFNPHNAGGDNGRTLFNALNVAVLSNINVFIPTFQYNIPGIDASQSEVNWWKMEITPVVDSNGDVTYLLVTIKYRAGDEITKDRYDSLLSKEQCLIEDHARANEELTITNIELAASNEEMQSIIHDLELWQLALDELNQELQGQVKEKTKQLIDNMVQMRAAIDSAKLGTWKLCLMTREFTTSIRFKEIYGYSSKAYLPLSVAVMRVCQVHQSYFLDAVDVALDEAKDLDIEYIIIRVNDNERRTVKLTGKTYFDIKGIPAYLAGTMQDITGLKLA